MKTENPFGTALPYEPAKYDKTILITVEQNGGKLAYAYAIYDNEKAIHKGAALVPGATTWQGELLAAKDALAALEPSQRILVVIPTDRLQHRLTSNYTAGQFTTDWETLKTLASQQDISFLCINGGSGDLRMDACRTLAKKVLQSETKGGG